MPDPESLPPVSTRYVPDMVRLLVQRQNPEDGMWGTWAVVESSTRTLFRNEGWFAPRRVAYEEVIEAESSVRKRAQYAARGQMETRPGSVRIAQSRWSEYWKKWDDEANVFNTIWKDGAWL